MDRRVGKVVLLLALVSPAAQAAEPKADGGTLRAIEKKTEEEEPTRMHPRAVSPERPPERQSPKRVLAPARRSIYLIHPVVDSWSFEPEPGIGRVAPDLLASSGVLTFRGRGFGEEQGTVSYDTAQIEHETHGKRLLTILEWTPEQIRVRMPHRLKGPTEPTSTPLRIERPDGGFREIPAQTQIPTYVRSLRRGEDGSGSCYQSDCALVAGRALSTRHTISAGEKNVMGRDFWNFELQNACVFERMPSWNVDIPNHQGSEDFRQITPRPGSGSQLSPPTTGAERWQVQVDWVLQGGDAMSYSAEVDVRCPKGY